MIKKKSFVCFSNVARRSRKTRNTVLIFSLCAFFFFLVTNKRDWTGAQWISNVYGSYTTFSVTCRICELPWRVLIGPNRRPDQFCFLNEIRLIVQLRNIQQTGLHKRFIRRTWPDRWANCTRPPVAVSSSVCPCSGPSPGISCARWAPPTSPGPSSAPRSPASSWPVCSGTTWSPARWSGPGWTRSRPGRPATGTSGTGNVSPARISGDWWKRCVTCASSWAAPASWTGSSDWNWCLRTKNRSH